ncbi:MAG TPA: hypothetical protein VJS38_05720 [Phenylobacterium sp.]|uniref:hypothetical protein n=1 Tax=Phenylobacterium sp. TaxID=1871053 RepID=UPI002B4A6256|nr:hypothetical protein [Phenylobacterium sp.]HKR87655.1 hypothetical protein [Phenylobacterium sp.]
MDSAILPSDLPPRSVSEQAQVPPVDQMMRAYVGYLAGWFDIAQLAAGRRLERSGVRRPLLSD